MDALITLKQLYNGHLQKDHLFSAWRDGGSGGGAMMPLPLLAKWDQYFPVSWEQSSKHNRRLVEEIQAAVQRAFPTGPDLRGEAALRRLALTPVGGYGTGEEPSSHRLLPRGATTSMVVPALALPSGKRPPVKASTLSPRVARVFLDPRRRMLSSEEARLARLAGVRPYSDPGLRNVEMKLELSMRMHDGRMLGTSETCGGEVDLFAVVKKWVEAKTPPRQRPRTPKVSGPPPTDLGGSSSSTAPPSVYQQDEAGAWWEMIQRLIADLAKINCSWEPPPKVQLSSTESVANLDCSEEVVQEGDVPNFQADMPEYYYTLDHPRGLPLVGRP